MLAIRPRTLPAAAAPVLVGAAFAFYDGVFQFLPALAALLGALLLQIGANVGGFVFVIASLHLLYINTRLLPEHIRPPMWRRVGLVAMCLFYGFFVTRSAMAFWNG